jgi:RNA recognition motif-containing protein
MKKLFVGGLPSGTTEASLTDHFSRFGKVHSIKLIKDLFSGDCKGFGFIEMEGHEARAAITGVDGKMFEGQPIKVRYEDKKSSSRQHRRR